MSRSSIIFFKSLGFSAVILLFFGIVQSVEYHLLMQQYERDMALLEAKSMEVEAQKKELEELRKGWVYSHFNGKLSDSVRDIARNEAVRQGLDPALVMAVIEQESAGKQSARSRVGAIGLMQLMPGTAKHLKVDAKCPKQNVKGGVEYLKRLLRKYGDIRNALMAYNWGPGNMDSWIATGKGRRGQDMPKETQRYADGVLQRIERVDLLASI